MKYELLLRGRAKADIRRAAKWYERQRKGLGRDFVAEVDAALGLIGANPEQYEVVHREIPACHFASVSLCCLLQNSLH